MDFTCRGKFIFSKQISYDNMMEDMSAGGLKFMHGTRLKIGTSLGLTIHPPHTFLPLQARGKVTWVQSDKKNGTSSYSIGVKFKRMNERERRQVLQVIDALAGYFGIPRVTEMAKGKRRVR